MRPENPIVLVSSDNTRVGAYRTVEEAEKYFSDRRDEDEQFGLDLLLFDGLARPMEARLIRNQVKLVVAQPLITDPWQVRVRVIEAVKRKRAWVADQDDAVTTPNGRILPRAETEERLGELEYRISYEISFAEFILVLVEIFEPGRESRWCICCLFCTCKNGC